MQEQPVADQDSVLDLLLDKLNTDGGGRSLLGQSGLSQACWQGLTPLDHALINGNFQFLHHSIKLQSQRLGSDPNVLCSDLLLVKPRQHQISNLLCILGNILHEKRELELKRSK